jgi:2',3'-cyclic-nucleotide 2'-phosphodiesterase/3'-nucleotidase/5'-nucleotidase
MRMEGVDMQRRVALVITLSLGFGCAGQPAESGVSKQTDIGISKHALQNSINLTPIGTYASGTFAGGAAEIVEYDSLNERLFVVNTAAAKVDAIDISTPSAPTLAFSIDVSPFGVRASSVAVHSQRQLVVAVVPNPVAQQPGTAAFYDLDGTFLSAVKVGSNPDKVEFTPNGAYALVANEGIPNASYTVDPEGTVSVITVRNGRIAQSDVRSAGFQAFNNVPLDPSIRIFGPGASVAQDLEPEHLVAAQNNLTAWVSLQENNAVAVVDVPSATVTGLFGLGFKNHSLPGKGLDPSDRDNGIRIANWPVFGMYQPDSIEEFKIGSTSYLLTANEGDAREYAAFAEEARVGTLTLDPAAFPNAAALKQQAALGRLRVTTAMGDTDHDGDFDQLYAFGARSFSIWTTTGSLIFDSGDALEQITAAALPTNFNSNNDANNSFDTRSDDKGPEPEGVALGKVGSKTYAFIGLERVSGVVVYDISTPAAPVFVQYVNPRNFAGSPAAGTAGDLGPEGLFFIPIGESPIQSPLLIVANEVSGTTTIYQITNT